jgi:hypothetical protein
LALSGKGEEMNQNSDLIERMVDDGKIDKVEKIIETDEGASRTPDAFVPPTVEGYSTQLPAVGIHFGVPEEVYHAWPALSNSGIRKLAASPTLFYMTTPWLKAPEQEEEEEKAWAVIGKAYHARILEGREVFNQRFCNKLEKKAVEGLLTTVSDLQAAIVKAGHQPLDKIPTGEVKQAKNSTVDIPITRAAKKEDYVAQLLAINPDAPIWEECQRRYEEANAGRTQLAYEIMERIEIAAAMIERHEELSVALSGGHPEVSLFWYDPKTGVPMKARVDYLKIKMMVDLKSYENKFELSPENAIRKAISNQRYSLQPCVYLEAAQAVKALIRETSGKGTVWKWQLDVQEKLSCWTWKAATDELLAWALKWAARTEEPEWLWVFQQKGVAPITRGILFPRGGTNRLLFDEIVSRMKRRFKQFAEGFGTDTWLDLAPIDDTFADEDISPYSSEI